MRKKILKVALVVGAVIIAGSLLVWGRYWRFIESTDDAYVQADNAIISPKVSGYVANVAANENQTVHKGDVLVALEDDDYIAARDQAKAAVAAAEAEVQVLVRQDALQGALIEKAAAGVTAAAAKAHDADTERDRDAKLIGQGYVTKERQDADNDAATSADAEVVSASSSLDAARRQLAVVHAQEIQAKASLEQARARLNEAQINLDHTIIRAPMDGVVGNRSVQVGDFVGPGSQLFTLVPKSDLYVIANFKETQVGRMRVGQPVTMYADINSAEKLHGVVASLSPATGSEFSILPPQNATGNFTKIVQRVPIKIAFTKESDPPAILRPGLSIVVSVDTRAAP